MFDELGLRLSRNRILVLNASRKDEGSAGTGIDLPKESHQMFERSICKNWVRLVS